MDGICLACGVFADLEPFIGLDAHHVAGRHNHARLTVLVCRPCHAILSSWQRAAGIDLKEQSLRTELDALRALAVGATHLLRLYAERHGDASPIPAPLAVHTARAISLLMDSSGTPDRPARWLPDPRVPPIAVVPVGPPGDDPDRISEVAYLAAELSRELGEPLPQTAELFGRIGDRPEQAQAALAQVFEDPPTVEELLRLVDEVLTRGAAVVRQLLELPDLRRIDDVLLDEARLWIDTDGRLLQQVLDSVLPLPEGGER